MICYSSSKELSTQKTGEIVHLLRFLLKALYKKISFFAKHSDENFQWI